VVDLRVRDYARLLVERCARVEPGWQVAVLSSPPARPLITAVVREIARRGAYALPRLSFGGGRLIDRTWLAEAPAGLIGELSPIDRHAVEHFDAVITIEAPENTREESALPPDRLAAAQKAGRPLRDRLAAHEIPWVVCQYPTPALAQEAGMSVEGFEELLFRACLLDWDSIGTTMRRLADRLDKAEEVRIVGDGTDVTIGIHGRSAILSDGRRNMPDGEFFYAPVEDTAEGTIAFAEFPAAYEGRVLRGIRLRFAAGRVVDADAEAEAGFLHEVLDTDEGARRLGELGIGCNPGITTYLMNTLFDEKMAGTVHLALGNSYTAAGGLNESAIHWDLVKDLRTGGRLYADGELVQADGIWQI
jgi:aminopeptidase